VPDGEAWVAGSCGLRGRLTPSGFVDLSAPPRRIRQNTGAQKWDCQGTAFYSSLAASSTNDAYFSGQTRCGLDPNGIWARPIEHYDGKQFHDLPSGPAFSDPHRRSPDVLLLDSERIKAYVLALGDDSHGAPECGVYELSQGRLALLRSCKVPRPDGPGASERFLSIAIDGSGEPWVSGRRFAEGAAEGDGTPFLLHLKGGQWRDEGAPDSGVLTRSADGTLWLFGSKAWLLLADGWHRSDVPVPSGAADFAVESASDVWIATENGLLHFDGAKLSRTPFDSPPPSTAISQVRISGRHIWASSAFFVWELRSSDQPPPQLWDKQ